MFTNQSGDAAQDYFSDGLTEDITRALGRFKELTVIAYGAVLPFRNKELPLSEIGRALNARYLVSGSVRRMGQRVRVTVQLSDAANGTQLWSEQYDDELSDIFAVQERIARRVAGTLASSLQQIALQQSLRKPTDNLDAYDLLLRARALAADPTRARQPHGARAARAGDAARAGLRRRLCRARRHLFPARAFGWSEFAQTGRRDGDPARPEGDRARRGLRAGPQRAGARLHVGPEVRPRPGRIGAGAADQSQRRRGPADAGGRAAVDRPHRRIDRRPPRPPCASTSVSAPEAALNLGLAYLLARRYADAVRLLEAARARYPTYPLLDFPLAAAYAELGRNDDAQDAVEQGKRKNPHFDLASFGSRFQDPALQRRVEESLRKAGLN